MKQIIRISFGFITAVLLSGCATVVMRTELSGEGNKGLYPATRGDVSGAISYCKNELDPLGGVRGAATQTNPNILEKFLWVTFSIIDLPISIVFDTLLLPIDLIKVDKEVKRKKEKIEQQPPSTVSAPVGKDGKAVD